MNYYQSMPGREEEGWDVCIFAIPSCSNLKDSFGYNEYMLDWENLAQF